MVATSIVFGIKRRRRIALATSLTALAVTLGIISFLSPGPNLAEAERALEGPPTFSYPGERGQPIAHCAHTSLLGLFGSDDACTLTFPSGDSYRCTVAQAGNGLGLASSCASRPFRHG